MSGNTSDWLKNFVGGAVAGGTLSVPLLFVGTHHFFEFVIKWIGVSFVALTTGLCTVAGNDLWKSCIKPKLKKYFTNVKIKKRKQDGSDKTDSGKSDKVA